MCKFAIVLVCLACAVHGRRVQPPTAKSLRSPPRRSPLREFRRLLDAQSITSAPSNYAPGHHWSAERASEALLGLRGGDAEPVEAILKATYACNQLRSSVVAWAMEKVFALRKILECGEAVPSFGTSVDEIMTAALAKFNAEVPQDDAEVLELYQTKAEGIRQEILTSLEPAFVQQLVLLKDAALELFKKGMMDGDATEAFISAEQAFMRHAREAVPAGTGWDFELEHDSLVRLMKAILAEQKKANTAKLQSAQQMQTALTYLQMQQKQMEEIQGQAMRAQGSHWNFGAAWRPDDTNINLSAAYQGGRANLQVSMVPDESANMLGPNGFSGGVGPANLGLSFNIKF